MSVAKEREYFSSNLSLLLKAAVPIGEALHSLAETAQTKQMKKKLVNLGKEIDEGVPLTQALEHSHLVSKQTLILAQLGEESGTLVENLALAAEQEAKQRIFKSKLRSAMMYPAFVLGMTLVVGLGIAWFLLPRLAETFAQLHANLPPISKAMIGVGLFLRDNGIWAVPSIFGGIFLLVISVTTIPFFKHTGQRMLLHLPGVGRLAHELEVARFGYMLGTLIDAGLNVPKALLLLESASGSPQYKKLFHYLANSIDKGMSFRQSFVDYPHINKLLPPSARQAVIAGEDSGSLSQTLRLVGSAYDEKVEATTRNFEVLIEPVMLVGVWIGVLLVAVAVILPIYSLIGGLNS